MLLLVPCHIYGGLKPTLQARLRRRVGFSPPETS